MLYIHSDLFFFNIYKFKFMIHYSNIFVDFIIIQKIAIIVLVHCLFFWETQTLKNIVFCNFLCIKMYNFYKEKIPQINHKKSMSRAL